MKSTQIKTLGIVMGLLAAAQAFPVDVRSLLQEMPDLFRLTRRANPSYTTSQASSYDRASKNPQTEWFANNDWGQFLRVEEVGGRKEYVMAELKGPGAVVRIWSANPVGVVRFYFDGQSSPAFVANLGDLLNGKVAPFGSPYAYMAARGTNLYFPFPYAKSLKITVDDSAGENVKRLYYHVNYRTYPGGTQVKTFSREQLGDVMDLIQQTAKRLRDPEPPAMIAREQAGRTTLLPKQPVEILRGSGNAAVAELRIRLKSSQPAPEDVAWDDPRALQQVTRHVRIVAEFDGERCIDAPVADFFGQVAGLAPFATLPLETTADGWMVCRFMMPWGKSASIRLENLGTAIVSAEFDYKVAHYRWGSESMHFHAQWASDTTFTRPMRDMEFLKVQGEGRFVGASLHIANPVPTWWGEGDEKVFVDGEAFPSTFGTGTEDYFGYAWGSPQLFQEAYHAQPRCDGPGTQGHSTVMRFHVFDDIPYKKSIQFDIELWHWAEVEVEFDRMAYWYARPGGSQARQTDPKQLSLVHIAKPEPVKGALEGESMKVIERTGGVTETQDFGDLSNGKQLWWRDGKVGDKLVLEFPVAEDGEYGVVGNFCIAPDYGRHWITIEGQRIAQPMEFYSSGLSWQVRSLGRFKLKKGTARLTIEVEGKHASAVARYMFGLDYLLLKK